MELPIICLEHQRPGDQRNERVPDVRNVLVEAGLYRDEAKAMLATWKTSYFEQEGLRIFWVVPSEMVDELLPLQINPTPDETKRVFVGRVEVLTPAQVDKIMTDFQKNRLSDYKNDRYYLGMLERARQIGG